MTRRKNIQTILSFHFLLISVTLLVLTSVFFSYMQYRTLRKNTVESMEVTCVSVADSLEQQIYQMNMVSLNTISSSAIRQAFEDYRPDGQNYQQTLLRHQLSNSLTTAKGLDFSIRQLNLYRMDGGGYGVGSYNGDLPFHVQDMNWYQMALEKAGRMVLSDPDIDTFLAEKGNENPGRNFLSLCRMFYNNAHVPLGIVEVKKYYSEVFRMADQPQSAFHPSIHIYDMDGRQLYPLKEDTDGEFSYFNAVNRPGTDVSSGNGDVFNTARDQKEYIWYTTSDENHLLVVAAIRYSEFWAPVYRSLRWILVGFLFLFAVCLLISNLLSKQISTPIRKIYHFLSDEKKDQFQPILLEDTGIQELDKLKNSLNENIRQRKASTSAMMVLKEQEVQAQMLALQSQMNPHFLYNSLSTIAEMAEEGMTTEVAHMCRQITEIFRYISSNREQRCVLEEELELCDMYLECMKMRFGENLQYSIDVDDDILECMTPKLCVQLLVENATKFTTRQSPPWKVRIKGWRKEEDWYITVQDNGPGFQPDVDQTLRHQMDDILRDGILPSLKIEGMGILNIFIRLYLLDGIPFIFDFGNLPEGGAFVTIGGHIRENED